MSLLGITIFQTLLSVGIIIICVLLMLVILVQQASGGGLVGAFGGGGASGAFGAKTGDMFTWITVVLASVYLVFNVVGNYLLLPRGLETPAVVTTAPSGSAPAPSGATTDTESADQPGEPSSPGTGSSTGTPTTATDEAAGGGSAPGGEGSTAPSGAPSTGSNAPKDDSGSGG